MAEEKGLLALCKGHLRCKAELNSYAETRMIQGGTQFVSVLDAASKKKARDELNERNEKDTILAVQSLREWALQQDWLKSPTDYAFLLRFLRFRKFSQLDARKALEKFWTVRTGRPDWFTNEDPFDPVLLKLMRMGAFYASPKRDKHGRIVMFGGFEKLDTEFFKSVGVSKMYHMSALLCDWLTFNEHAQVNGVVFVSNYAGITWSMITTLYNPEFEKEFTSYFQKSLPIRVKSLDIFNEPPFFDAIWAMVSIILSKKLKSRFHLHGKSLVKIYNEIGYECIPDEYLPDDYEGPRAGTIAQVVEKMIEDMRRPEFLTYIRDLSSGKYGVDKSRIPAKTSDESPAASYRKINTD